MNDRTLLELAARAAGIKARWFKVNQWRRLDGCRLHTGQKDVLERIIASHGARSPTTATR